MAQRLILAMWIAFMDVVIVAPYAAEASAGSEPAADMAEYDIQQTIYAYFDALKTGNLQSIMSVLSKKNLSKREKILQVEGYSESLVDRYRGATIVIGSYKPEFKGRYLVDTTIQYPSGEEQNIRFYLVREGMPAQLRIEDEATPME